MSKKQLKVKSKSSFFKNSGVSKKDSTSDKSSARIFKQKPLPNLIPILIFAITTFIFFYSQLTGSSYFWEDFTEYIFPTQTFAATQLARGEIPHWNPYSFAGMPFIADIQVGFFYPLNRILTFFVTSDGKLPVWPLQFIVILHYFIAQLTLYYLCRNFKISSWGSIIAAISYGFSMIIVCHAIHPMIVEHLAWFPLVILLLYNSLTRLKLKYAILAGLIFGMSMLSGHPQTTLYEALFLGFMTVWFFIAIIIKKEINGFDILRYISYSALTILIAIGIFCIQYLPSQELASLSQRSEMKYEDATIGSLEYKQLYTAIVPKIFGSNEASKDNSLPYHLVRSSEPDKPLAYHHYWETAFYLGLVALLIGIIGAIKGYRQRIQAFLIFTAIFGLIYALGPNGFLFPIFFNLPFFGTFRNPARMMFFFILAMAILSGFGFDHLTNNIKNKKLFKLILIVSGIALLISILTTAGILSSALDTPEQFVGKIQSQGLTSLLFILIIIFVMWLIYKGILYRHAAGTFLAIIAFLDLYIVNSEFNRSPENPEAKYTLNTEIKKAMKPHLPDDIFRVNMRMYQPVSYMAFNRNLGMTEEIMLTEGYNPLILQRVLPPINSRDTINMLYNVKYEIRFDTNTKHPYFHQRDDYYPRAWLVSKAKVLDSSVIADSMRAGRYNYLETVVLEEEPGIKLSDEQNSTDISRSVMLKCLVYSNNYLKYEVNTSRAGILCFSEIWYPSWKAYINGKPGRLLRANYCFRAVPLNEGKSIIELKYESDKYENGKLITLITLFGSIIAYITTIIIQKRKLVKNITN